MSLFHRLAENASIPLGEILLPAEDSIVVTQTQRNYFLAAFLTHLLKQIIIEAAPFLHKCSNTAIYPHWETILILINNINKKYKP